jgi:hypothetical protein
VKRIVLFRFHKKPHVCKSNLRLLRRHNPGIQIFGLFGGTEERLQYFEEILGPYLETIYCIRGKTSHWKRTHGDLAIRLWYMEFGRTLSFDVVHHVEWDLMFLKPLEKIYEHIPNDGVGLTSLTLLRNIEKKWYWLSEESQRHDWHELLRFAKDRYRYNQEPYACEFVGACLPKKFLEEYSLVEIPELCHDELRVPLFSQVFKLKQYNTHICRKGFDEPDDHFNCNSKEIRIQAILKECANPSGSRAFHPIRNALVFDMASYVAKLVFINRMAKVFSR